MTSCIVDWLCVCSCGYSCLDIVSIVMMTARVDMCIAGWLYPCSYGYLCLDIVSIVVMTARDDIMHCRLVVCLWLWVFILGYSLYSCDDSSR